MTGLSFSFWSQLKLAENNWKSIRSISFATAMNAGKTYSLQAAAY